MDLGPNPLEGLDVEDTNIKTFGFGAGSPICAVQSRLARGRPTTTFEGTSLQRADAVEWVEQATEDTCPKLHAAKPYH